MSINLEPFMFLMLGSVFAYVSRNFTLSWFCMTSTCFLHILVT